jgi:hypothetical protein
MLDLESNRRLRHEQRIGSPGKAQMFCDGMKDLQTPVSHDYSPMGVCGRYSITFRSQYQRST